jgi:hypothetical protein
MSSSRDHLRAEAARLTAAVRQVIDEWDPYGLLAGGAPLDEWDSEIASLVAQAPRITSPTEGALAVSRVFSSAFQPDGFSPSDCAAVGDRLFAAVLPELRDSDRID